MKGLSGGRGTTPTRPFPGRRSLTSTCNLNKHEVAWYKFNRCSKILKHDGHCEHNSQCVGDLVCGYHNCQSYNGNVWANADDNCCFDPREEGHVVVVGSDFQYFPQTTGRRRHCPGFATTGRGPWMKDQTYKTMTQTECRGNYEHDEFMLTMNHFAANKANVAAVAMIGDMTEDGTAEQLARFEGLTTFDQWTNFYPSVGNHDVWNQVKEWKLKITPPQSKPEPLWAMRMEKYMRAKLKMMDNNGLLEDYDKSSMAYYYKIGGLIYINLQMHPAFKGFSYIADAEERKIGSPYKWFKKLLRKLPRWYSDMTGIILMFHLPDYSDKEDYIDAAKWNDLINKMRDYNANHQDKAILAAFTGHFHHLTGYFPKDIKRVATDGVWARQLEDGFGNRPIRRFVCGGQDYMSFLSLEMFENQQYYRVFAHTRQYKVAGGWDTQCISQKGLLNSGGKCTHFHFDGTMTEENQRGFV